MMALAALFVSAIGASPEVFVNIAPDQPAPHIYIGDPLILEFRAGEECVVSAEAEIRPDFPGEPIVVELNDIRLQPESPRWCTIESVPDTRGRYFITIRFKLPEGLPEQVGAFCRIDRPAGEPARAPVCAVVDVLTPPQRLVLQTAGVRAVRVDVAAESDFAKVDAALDTQFQVIVRLRAQPGVCGEAGKRWHDRVACWQIESGGSADVFLSMVKPLKAGGSRSPIAAVVPDAATLKALLDAGAGRYVDTVAVDPAPGSQVLAEVRAAAERAGYERMEVQACIPPPAVDQPLPGALLARQGLDLIASGASLLVLDGALVAGDKALGPAFSYLEGCARLLAGSSPVAPLRVEGNARVEVFRAKDRWLAAAWCDSGEADVPIPTEGATAIELHDSRGNAVDCPAAANGAITLHVGPEPLFLEGKGGPLFQTAALEEARKEAEAFCSSEDVNKYVPKEAVDVVGKIGAPGGGKRSDFLGMVQIFPYLETQWHTGPIPRNVAVPALARLGRLARLLCVVEHERGEAFVEPLQRTLAACGEFESKYLTGSAGPDDGHERPDWLLDEVSRLMAEAEALAAEGRAIEASAVGTVAQWRAQALEVSSKAEPLSVAEKPKPVPEVKKEEPTKPAEEDQNKPEPVKSKKRTKKK